MCYISAQRRWVETNIFPANADKIGPSTFEDLETAIEACSIKNDWNMSKKHLRFCKCSAIASVIFIIAAVALAILLIIGTIVALPLSLPGLMVLGLAGMGGICVVRYYDAQYELKMQLIAQACSQTLYSSNLNVSNQDAREEMAQLCSMHFPVWITDALQEHFDEEDLVKWPFVTDKPPFGYPQGVYLYTEEEQVTICILGSYHSNKFIKEYKFKNQTPCTDVPNAAPLQHNIAMAVSALKTDLQLLTA